MLGDRVYVATVGDEAYALEASTGKVLWQKSLGTPVPVRRTAVWGRRTQGRGGRHAGDRFGIGGDLHRGRRWNQTQKRPNTGLSGLTLASGEEVVSATWTRPAPTPRRCCSARPSTSTKEKSCSATAATTAIAATTEGCGRRGPEDGGTPRFWQYQPALPSSSGGAVWATAGPSVGEEGNVYATTGNPDPPGRTEEHEIFDYSDSVVQAQPGAGLRPIPRYRTRVAAGLVRAPQLGRREQQRSRPLLRRGRAAARRTSVPGRQGRSRAI